MSIRRYQSGIDYEGRGTTREAFNESLKEAIWRKANRFYLKSVPPELEPGDVFGIANPGGFEQELYMLEDTNGACVPFRACHFIQPEERPIPDELDKSR